MKIQVQVSQTPAPGVYTLDVATDDIESMTASRVNEYINQRVRDWIVAQVAYEYTPQKD